MELSPTINETWKLCLLGSLVGCLCLCLVIDQSHLYASFSAAQNTIIQYKQSVFMKPVIEIETKTQNKCDFFDGRWVYNPKEDGPGGGGGASYDVKQCLFIEDKWNCRKNERPDFEYERWSWEAHNCVIPLFNGRDMLERLRNKRMILVGDSLNRNQWESLACLLLTSVPTSTAEVQAEDPIFKVLKAKDYNFTLEFYWDPFLVEQDNKHKSGSKVLMLDKLPAMSDKWRGADVMVFNSGHWWTHIGKFKSWDKFGYKGELIEEMSIEEAYKYGMETWGRWVSENVSPNKTRVFFRSISPEHQLQWCYNTTEPIKDESYSSKFPESMVQIIEGLIDKMNEETPSVVNYLNITKLSQYRRDAHPSVYRSLQWKDGLEKLNLRAFTDCSHWCLPGLPDTWNRLLYASLFFTSASDFSS